VLCKILSPAKNSEFKKIKKFVKSRFDRAVVVGCMYIKKIGRMNLRRGLMASSLAVETEPVFYKFRDYRKTM
jgi:hypothetical protein